VPLVRALLVHPPELVQAVARAYGERFGGGDDGALATGIRALVEGTPEAIDVDLMLHLAGLRSAREYEYLGICEAQVRTPRARERGAK